MWTPKIMFILVVLFRNIFHRLSMNESEQYYEIPKEKKLIHSNNKNIIQENVLQVRLYNYQVMTCTMYNVHVYLCCLSNELTKLRKSANFGF